MSCRHVTKINLDTKRGVRTKTTKFGGGGAPKSETFRLLGVGVGDLRTRKTDPEEQNESPPLRSTPTSRPGHTGSADVARDGL